MGELPIDGKFSGILGKSPWIKMRRGFGEDCLQPFFISFNQRFCVAQPTAAAR
jgi:hypothetical protein